MLSFFVCAAAAEMSSQSVSQSLSPANTLSETRTHTGPMGVFRERERHTHTIHRTLNGPRVHHMHAREKEESSSPILFYSPSREDFSLSQGLRSPTENGRETFPD